MKMPLNTIKKIMQKNVKSNDRPVSAKAIFLMAQKVEDFVAEKTQQAEDRLIRENELRGAQRLQPKKRISEEILREVL